MKTWDAFYSYILIYVPGCAQPTVEQALRLASMEFFEHSLAWRQWLDTVTSVAGQTEYDLDVPTSQEVVQLRSAKLAGEELPIKLANDSSKPHQQRIYTRDRLTFNLTLDPGAGAAIDVQVVLKPSLTATGISNELFSKFMQAICNGACARLMEIPAQSFNNPGLAADMRSRFRAAIQDAALDANRSYSDVRLRTRHAPL